MIEQHYFLIDFETRKESKLFKVHFRFEEAPGILDEFMDSFGNKDLSYYINHKIVYYNDKFIHQFDIFEVSNFQKAKLVDYKSSRTKKE